MVVIIIIVLLLLVWAELAVGLFGKNIDKSEIKTFNSHYSSSLGSNNNYSTVRVLNLDGVGFSK